jgi:hypothetical protein
VGVRLVDLPLLVFFPYQSRWSMVYGLWLGLPDQSSLVCHRGMAFLSGPSATNQVGFLWYFQSASHGPLGRLPVFVIPFPALVLSGNASSVLIAALTKSAFGLQFVAGDDASANRTHCGVGAGCCVHALQAGLFGRLAASSVLGGWAIKPSVMVRVPSGMYSCRVFELGVCRTNATGRVVFCVFLFLGECLCRTFRMCMCVCVHILRLQWCRSKWVLRCGGVAFCSFHASGGGGLK